MTKYARVKNGYLIDVYNVPEQFADLATLNRCLPGGGFIVVPDSAVHSAKDNGNGTYTNPSPAPAPAPAPVPLNLRPDEILDLLPASVVKAIRDSATASAVKRYECFKLKQAWTKAEGIALFNDIEGAGLMTAPQNAAAVAAWPEA